MPRNNHAASIDLRGLIVGKLTVIERAEISTDRKQLWLCQCECGQFTKAVTTDLKRGFRKYCNYGCPLRKPRQFDKVQIVPVPKVSEDTSIIGQRFNHLVITSYAGYRRKENMWTCVCDCGATTTVPYRALSSGNTQNCGHFTSTGIHRAAASSPQGMVGFKKLCQSYEYRAKKTNKVFELTREDIRELTQSNCFYCNQPPSQICNSVPPNPHNAYPYNGIDRINSKLGYVKGNVRPCCKACNFAKGSMPEKNFYDLDAKIGSKCK